MQNTLIADSGYLLALSNPRDRYHQECLVVSKTLEGDLITTWPVITETCYLLLKRQGVAAQINLLDKVARQLIFVWAIPDTQINRLKELTLQYADLPMDMADGSLVILAEALGHGRILSTDRRDFQTYRWKNRHPFENLLLPD